MARFSCIDRKLFYFLTFGVNTIIDILRCPEKVGNTIFNTKNAQVIDEIAQNIR